MEKMLKNPFRIQNGHAQSAEIFVIAAFVAQKVDWHQLAQCTIGQRAKDSNLLPIIWS